MTENKGHISDGYHTFDEMYAHRNLLFLNLVFSVFHYPDTNAYAVKNHLGEDWDLIVLQFKNQKQTSYHMGSSYRKLWEGLLEEKSATDHVYDGHTSKDVITLLEKRLGNWRPN